MQGNIFAFCYNVQSTHSFPGLQNSHLQGKHKVQIELLQQHIEFHAAKLRPVCENESTFWLWEWQLSKNLIENIVSNVRHYSYCLQRWAHG